MNMTPFALLNARQLEKRAATYQAPTYQPGRVPGASDVSAPEIKQPGVIDNMAGDIAMSMIPGVGTAYQYNKAIGDARNGRWGSAIANTLWGTLSLIPGVAALRAGKAAFTGLRAAAKAAPVAGAVAPAVAQPGVIKSMYNAAMANPAIRVSGNNKLNMAATAGVYGGSGMILPGMFDKKRVESQPLAETNPNPTTNLAQQASDRIKAMGLSYTS